MALGYVRPARESDAEEIARIQLTTWRVGYKSIVPEKVLEELDQDWLAQQWAPACKAPSGGPQQVFIAVEQDESDRGSIRSVGFAAVGPASDTEDPGTGMVTEMLVEPRFGRRGHGSRLLAAAVTHWQAHHLSPAYAWAFVRDSASLKFFRSAGWEADGVRRTLDMHGTQVPQIRLHADVSESPQV